MQKEAGFAGTEELPTDYYKSAKNALGYGFILGQDGPDSQH